MFDRLKSPLDSFAIILAATYFSVFSLLVVGAAIMQSWVVTLVAMIVALVISVLFIWVWTRRFGAVK